MDGNVWRIDGLDGLNNYPSCHFNELGNAIVISKEFSSPVFYADKVEFKSFCYNGHPIYMAARYEGIPAEYLPQIMKDWHLYTSIQSKFGRNFNCSIYSFLMSYAANSVITICLTILAFIIIRKRPHFIAANLLRAGSLVASANMISTVSRIFVILKTQHVQKGVVISEKLIDFLQKDATFTALNFISVTLIQFCQVFLVMRTFERNLERRIIFYLSSFLILITNILWVAPQFGTVIQRKKVNWSTFPTFIYLFRIAVSSSYACLIISFIFKQRKLWYRHLQLSFLTFLVILSVLLSPGFFIADIANAWIDVLGESFTTTCYLAATFMVWEWLERFNVLKTQDESQSILGREIFLDDQQEYNFANYSLKDKNYSYLHKNRNDYNGSNEFRVISIELKDMNSNNLLQINANSLGLGSEQTFETESVNQIEYETQQSQREKMTYEFTRAINKFLIYTDQAIFKKLGSSLVMSSMSDSSASKNREIMVKKRIGLDKPSQTFVYYTKNVIFSSDSEDNDENENDEDSLLIENCIAKDNCKDKKQDKNNNDAINSDSQL